MIAAKYRLFSAEPKASRFPRYAHTEEVAVLHFRFGPPRDKSRMVGNSYLGITSRLLVIRAGMGWRTVAPSGRGQVRLFFLCHRRHEFFCAALHVALVERFLYRC